MTLMVVVVVAAELLVLGHIYGETHAETRREAQLVGQLLQEPIRRLNEGPRQQDPGFDYRTAFSLHKLSALQKLNIHLVSEDGRILDSNQHPSEQTTMVTRLLVWLVDKHIGLMTERYPVSVAGEYVGDIVISNNLSNELEEVITRAIEILMPWFLLFVLSSLILVKLFLYLLDNIVPVLSTDQTGQASIRRFDIMSLLNPQRLPMQLITAVGQLNRCVHQQKRCVITAHESERKRLAAELHDELGQHLTAMRIELDKLLQHEQPQMQTALDRLKVHTERISEVVRSNLTQLNPPALSKQGLRDCLESLINDWRVRHSHHQLVFKLNCHPRLLDMPSQLTVYRIVQECLTNISRHAGSKVKVEIEIRRQADNAVIHVRDNGAGCDLESGRTGFGLQGMKERVEALSGEFSVTSQPGQGMQVTATLPLRDGNNYQ